MNSEEKKAYENMVRDFQERDDPTGWFDSIYKKAKGDYRAVFWADLVPGQHLLSWVKKKKPSGRKGKIAAVVGCGVGDDAEALSILGYQVYAFDVSPSAIELCKKRYPNSKVEYDVANLFDLQEGRKKTFDVVYECNTIQVLPGKYRVLAIEKIAELVKPNGHLLVSCRSRKQGEKEGAIPLPLDEEEIDGFLKHGFQELEFDDYLDEQIPPVPHFFAVYQREDEA